MYSYKRMPVTQNTIARVNTSGDTEYGLNVFTNLPDWNTGMPAYHPPPPRCPTPPALPPPSSPPFHPSYTFPPLPTLLFLLLCVSGKVCVLESVYVCACLCEREILGVFGCVCVLERDRDCVCLGEIVCAWERESVCVCL